MAGDAPAAGGRWPNLFVIGAPRCGTSSLHAALARHPEITMSRPKEPLFFSLEPGTQHPLAVTDPDAYRAIFRHAPDARVLGESSTSYLWGPDVPARIERVSPDAKAIAILREPVERAHSYHRLFVAQGLERRPLLQALREDLSRGGPPEDPELNVLTSLFPGVASVYVDTSRYTEQLRRWRDVFADRLIVLFYEELVAEPEALRTIYRHVDVDPDDGPLELPELNVHRTSRGRLARAVYHNRAFRRLPGNVVWRRPVQRVFFRTAPKPPLDPRAESILRDELAGEREGVAALLGREPPWPR